MRELKKCKCGADPKENPGGFALMERAVHVYGIDKYGDTGGSSSEDVRCERCWIECLNCGRKRGVPSFHEDYS